MKKVTDCDHLICTVGTTIREVIRRIDASTPLLFQIVLDHNRRILGTVTDGDIRRGFARGLQLEDMVEACMHSPPITGRVGDETRITEVLRGRRFLPLCDAEGRFEYLLVEQLGPPRAERALILSGGLGSRLGERTKDTPKPLLPVAGKPILEHVLTRLETYGVQQIYISVHYLSDQIKRFVEERDNQSEITVLLEKEPLGTAGSLGLIDLPTGEPILTMNADVLTDVDLNALVEHHSRMGCNGTIAASRHEYQVPYGVLRFDENDILQGIEEKPTFYHLVAAGIYYLDASIIRLAPPGKRIDMPDLLKLAIESGLRLTVFPVHEYWTDVGRPADLDDADNFHKERQNGA